MKNIALLFVLFFIISTFGNAQNFKPVPQWLEKAVFYQIYPQSFKDVNGDGIGDIQGITEKLDYIKWLGCNALWLNPCFESSFQDAGYDVIDYYKVAKRYGTNKDLKNLFDEAHKRGIKVCIDLVAGHTSIDHPWFKESQKKKRNKYTDRFIWTNDSTIKPEKYVSGKFERNGTYRKNFFDCQPALNFGFAKPDTAQPWQQAVSAKGPQETRRELMRIMDFWLAMGCDGFRVDMAPSLIKNDADKTQTNKLWAEIRQHVQDKYPEALLLAEWGNPEAAIRAGFMMDFIIHLGGSGYNTMFFNKVGTYRRDTCYFSLDGNGSPTKFVNYFVKQLENIGDKGYLCVPTANHDFQRPHCGSRNTVAQLKTLMAFLMTIPGVPLVYYGDEIGMKFIDSLPNKEGSLLTKGNRAGSRTPMQWDKSATAGFSRASLDKFYLPLDASPSRPNVEAQKDDSSSFLNFTRKLISLHQSHPALATRSAIKFLYAQDNSYPLVYERTAAGETLIIVVNPSGKKQDIVLPYSAAKSNISVILAENSTLIYSENSLNISAGAVSFGIFKIAPQ
jgi:maltose alpha-D-glucosyltransferase / alpha-amylase